MNNAPIYPYFGYGYNLNTELFKERLKDGKWLSDGLHKTGSFDGPQPIDLGTYVLPDHIFSYNLDLQNFKEKGTVATVSVARNHQVLGALYHINEIQLKRLDRSEEVPRIYDRVLVKVHKAGAPQFVAEAWMDIANERGLTTTPHPEQYYVDEIVKAAEARGFPSSYIDKYLRFPPKV